MLCAPYAVSLVGPARWQLASTLQAPAPRCAPAASCPSRGCGRVGLSSPGPASRNLCLDRLPPRVPRRGLSLGLHFYLCLTLLFVRAKGCFLKGLFPLSPLCFLSGSYLRLAYLASSSKSSLLGPTLTWPPLPPPIVSAGLRASSCPVSQATVIVSAGWDRGRAAARNPLERVWGILMSLPSSPCTLGVQGLSVCLTARCHSVFRVRLAVPACGCRSIVPLPPRTVPPAPQWQPALAGGC